MKVKTDFITNSSSTAYIIVNTTEKLLDLVQFVKENPDLIEKFLKTYDYYSDEPERFNQEKLIESAMENNIEFQPGEAKYCSFGDEERTLVGHVFDYMLREGGTSESFSWSFYEWLR